MATTDLDEFLAQYNPDGTHPVTVIEANDGGRDTSPFIIIIRYVRYTALVNPLGFGGPDGYLALDIHSFASGLDAAAGVFGMTEGVRHEGFRGTGETSAGWPAARLVVVLVGKQGREK